MMQDIFLGVNIDHVATLRQARGTKYPDPIHAAFESIAAGASNITLHLREDRRHIQDEDVRILKATLSVPMNLELALVPFMIDFAEIIQPEQVCFVPEKREELTTEGGLDVLTHFESLKTAVHRLQSQGSDVSVFIDPDRSQIDAVVATGARAIELHTGCYADAIHPQVQQKELTRLSEAAEYAHQQGLVVHAGHGLHYHNVKAVAAINVIHTLNIGHAIISHAIFCGIKQAVREMRSLMQEARQTHE
jgi:pyridoxine 5-phosphate synthase